ncbi:MAG: DUF2071 domain-containing protein [Verrucomicrobiota bacterium]
MRSNPFAVEAWFDYSITLTFAVPLAELKERLPPSLLADDFENQFGFVAVAMVKTRRLRPKGLPAFLGRNFILIGYRYFVRFQSKNGRRLRGLLILRSETDSPRMVTLGNLFTSYKYTKTGIRLEPKGNLMTADDPETGLYIEADLKPDHEVRIPESSPFQDWKQARRFSGPMPFTFSDDALRREVRIVEGVRSNWKPSPVEVREWKIPYLKSLGFSETRLANAFVVRDVPYHWKAGRSEPWT